MKTSLLIAICLLLHALIQIEGQIEISGCGRLNATIWSTRLTKGYSSVHHWPWHAAIYHQFHASGPEYKCGGTLISRRSVLTAAHCVCAGKVQLDVDIVTVLLGRLNLAENENSTQKFGASEILVHLEYESEKFAHDIAIIRLSDDAVFNDYVQPVCLWKSDKTAIEEVVGKLGTVIGWGLTETGVISNVLQEAQFPVVDFYTCVKRDPPFFGDIVTKMNFCAGNGNGTALCQGDSGGSITFEEDEIYYIRGVVSVSQGKQNKVSQTIDCDPTMFSVFTDVAKYLPWIVERATMEPTSSAAILRPPTDVNPEIDFSICGKLAPRPMPLMTNSNNARHWPWHAAIYHDIGVSDSIYRCGGTVISSKSILTAAHCAKIDANKISVSLGRLNLGVQENSAQTFRVTAVTVHPKFDPNNAHDDIAIIKLATDATFNRYVRPVCLWKSSNTDLSEIVGKLGTVIGWGQTETLKQSNVLQEGTFPVVSHATCRQSDGKAFGQFLYDTNFCAGHRNGTSTCEGDAGGSMTFEVDGVYYIRGIASFGISSGTGENIKCGLKYYEVFTDVAKYLPWIKDNQ